VHGRRQLGLHSVAQISSLVSLTNKATENTGADILVCVTRWALTLTEGAASAVVLEGAASAVEPEALGGSEVRFNSFSWSQRVSLVSRST